MLISFSLENFRSFKDEQTLNLIASRRLGNQDPRHCHAVPDTDESTLRLAAIYGANGAGKSNLVKAFKVVERLVVQGTKPGKRIMYQPFVLEEASERQPSCFELQFVQDARVFRYGFCCDAERVQEEWLSTYEGKKERSLFSRTTGGEGKTEVELGSTGITSKLEALAKVGARPNQLFLTEVLNLDDPVAQGELFRSAIDWFSGTITIIDANAEFIRLAEAIGGDPGFATFAGEFLDRASTGIAGLEVLTREVPREGSPAGSTEFLEKILTDLPDGQVATLKGRDGEEYIVDGSGGDSIKVRHIDAVHTTSSGKTVKLPLREESDGSRRLLHLLPALYKLESGEGLFVIDELERSMHPMLARKFLEFFLDGTRTSNSQLIFTTHESTILDLELLRRDGIWFTEKTGEGATQLYSLAEFKIRNDLRVAKGYLHGRFGAIPFLGELDSLIEQEPPPEEPR